MLYPGTGISAKPLRGIPVREYQRVGRVGVRSDENGAVLETAMQSNGCCRNQGIFGEAAVVTTRSGASVVSIRMHTY